LPARRYDFGPLLAFIDAVIASVPWLLISSLLTMPSAPFVSRPEIVSFTASARRTLGERRQSWDTRRLSARQIVRMNNSIGKEEQ